MYSIAYELLNVTFFNIFSMKKDITNFHILLFIVLTTVGALLIDVPSEVNAQLAIQKMFGMLINILGVFGVYVAFVTIILVICGIFIGIQHLFNRQKKEKS